MVDCEAGKGVAAAGPLSWWCEVSRRGLVVELALGSPVGSLSGHGGWWLDGWLQSDAGGMTLLSSGHSAQKTRERPPAAKSLRHLALPHSS